MAINPEQIDVTTVDKLDDLNLALGNFFAHTNLNGKLGKSDFAKLAAFLAPYVTAIGGSGFVATTGTVLPAASAGKYTIVGAGTFTQTTGGSVVTTELFNILGSSATTWSLVKAIPLPSNIKLKTDPEFPIYPTIEAANLAILGAARTGRIVQIGTANNYHNASWQGGIADGNLIDHDKVADAKNDLLNTGFTVKTKTGADGFNLSGYWSAAGAVGASASYVRSEKIEIKKGGVINVKAYVSGATQRILFVLKKSDSTSLYSATSGATSATYIATEDCYMYATTLVTELANSYIKYSEKTLVVLSELSDDIKNPFKLLKGDIDGELINVTGVKDLVTDAVKYEKRIFGAAINNFYGGYSYVLPVLPGQFYRVTAKKQFTGTQHVLIAVTNVNPFDTVDTIAYGMSRVTIDEVKDYEIVIPDNENAKFLTVTAIEDGMAANYNPEYEVKIIRVGNNTTTKTYTTESLDDRFQNPNYKIQPFEIGAYPTLAGYDTQTINVDMVYDLWDSLVGTYDNPIEDIDTNVYQKLRVTKELRGRDESDTYDIFAYTFEPNGYTKTVLISACMHGTEKINTFSMFEIMKSVVNGTNSDFEVLDYIRKKVKVVIIPILNPWGFNAPRYPNVNLINPNRNFQYYWGDYVSNPDSIFDQKGDAPFSEAETRVLRDIAIELRGELTFAMDLHTGEGTASYPFIYFDSKDESGIKQGALQSVNRLISEFKKKNVAAPQIGDIQETARDLKLYWFTRCLMVPAVTIEVGPNAFGTVALSASQINGVVNMQLIYLSYLLAVNFTNRPQQLGVKYLTKSQYDGIKAKNYNTIYKTTDTSETYIGDVPFI